MTDYASSIVNLTYGTTSAVADQEVARAFTATASPTSYQHQKPKAVTAGGGTTIDQEQFATSIDELIVWNRDATNYVTLSYICKSANSAQSVQIPAGQWVKLVDVKITGTISITAHTAACSCEVWLVGT